MLWSKNRGKWKGWQSPGVEPIGHLAWASSALPLSHDSQATTNPHVPLYVLHKTMPRGCMKLKVGSLLMERIFWSTPNGVLMARAEWLPGVWPRHSVHHLCSTYMYFLWPQNYNLMVRLAKICCTCLQILSFISMLEFRKSFGTSHSCVNAVTLF